MTREELSKKVDDFAKKYQGQEKGYPTDNLYKGECLSIVKLYILEVFGITPPPSGSNSAYGYWTNFPSSLPTVFDKVQNTLTNVPFKGCVPIWDTGVGGGRGHIDIWISGDVNAWTGFDQNWNGKQAHLQQHDYKNVVGWLQPKLESTTIPEQPEENRQLVTDILLALKGSTSDNEINAWILKFENPKQMIEDVVANDGQFYKLQIEPRVGNEIQRVCEGRVKEAVELAKAEERKNCQTKVDSTIEDYQDRLKKANIEYETLLVRKVQNFSASTLISLGLKKLFSKGK